LRLGQVESVAANRVIEGILEPVLDPRAARAVQGLRPEVGHGRWRAAELERDEV